MLYYYKCIAELNKDGNKRIYGLAGFYSLHRFSHTCVTCYTNGCLYHELKNRQLFKENLFKESKLS